MMAWCMISELGMTNRRASSNILHPVLSAYAGILEVDIMCIISKRAKAAVEIPGWERPEACGASFHQSHQRMTESKLEKSSVVGENLEVLGQMEGSWASILSIIVA